MHECMIKDSSKFILRISIMKKENQIILRRNLKSDLPPPPPKKNSSNIDA
jgi:hypothetical protein